MATVIEIVRAHLKTEGFGGLVADGAGCGCELDDLAPCGADVWKYIDDHDQYDWDEAEYRCQHCGNTIYVELPD